MPLRVGTSTGSTVPEDIRVGSVPVQSVYAEAVEVWRRAYSWEQASLSKTITVPTWSIALALVALRSGSGGSGGNALNNDGKGRRPVS